MCRQHEEEACGGVAYQPRQAAEIERGGSLAKAMARDLLERGGAGCERVVRHGAHRLHALWHGAEGVLHIVERHDALRHHDAGCDASGCDCHHDHHDPDGRDEVGRFHFTGSVVDAGDPVVVDASQPLRAVLLEALLDYVAGRWPCVAPSDAGVI